MQAANGSDPLTKVQNRHAIGCAVDEMTAAQAAHTFLLLDFDSFKKLIDTFGAAVCDQLLIDTVEHLRRGLHTEDLIGRTGNDEFFICLKGISDHDEAERIAKHLCILARQHIANGVFTSASLGIVTSPLHGSDFETLYAKAHAAVQSAKMLGGNGCVFYDESLSYGEEKVISGIDHLERAPRCYAENDLVTYDCTSGKFLYPDSVLIRQADPRPLWQIMTDEGYASAATAVRFRQKLEEIAASDTPKTYFTECFLKNRMQVPRWFRVGFICPVPHQQILITFTDINDEISADRYLAHMAEYDELTGLLHRNAFCRTVEAALKADPSGVQNGRYAILYFDILRFKAINDMFGMVEGDRLLIYIAERILRNLSSDDAACRIGSDRFVVFLETASTSPETWNELLLSALARYPLPFEIIINTGIYLIDGSVTAADAMVDRAILAQASIKGSYTQQYSFYDESLRKDMLTEQEICGMMSTALSERQFVAFYQPQYNHSTGMLIGAEALVRWKHPERGLISPGLFIPIFEKNGFITKLDLYVFEEVCRFLRHCMDEGLPMIPISVNFSKHDIFQPDFAKALESLRMKHGVLSKYIRIEITESAIVGGSQHTNEIIRRLHRYGYIVEMDDFGSGYSSLNVLKDIELDIIKLDMQFLSERAGSNRGGTILSSVVRMAKWLCLPVIAEGVETVAQADFLRSIGCDCVQGYLYSRPLPEEAYLALLCGNAIGAEIPQMQLLESLNVHNFWDPKSLETLIFSNFVGGAAIFDYHDGKIEILRVNQKYLQELSMNLSEKDLIESDPLTHFDDANREIYLQALQAAIDTGEEQECETWRTIRSACCGDETFFIRSQIRLIGKSDTSCLFYAMIRNITSEKAQLAEILESERRFKMASEQVNIYYWEYNVATQEMRPCFRCMRDLGLPPLLTNYPDSAIERGIFPPEVAEMYRDWHRQVAEGVPELEAVIPLTMDRVPFRVRYTTEFDEHHRPIKAYGSAALIVQ